MKNKNSKRKTNLYQPNSTKPFRLSRSKIDLFLNCPRCFYLDRKLGVGRPPSFPFNLNSAVGALLKTEFDTHRNNKTIHPLLKNYGLNLIPFAHIKINEWRDSLRRGITYNFPKTNLNITGGVDDVWFDPKTEEIIIVDYKATSKNEEVSLDADWQIGYKRQMEIYQWLFRKNGFKVSDTGYFVYCNGDTDKEAFDAKLEFKIKLIPYKGKTDWIDNTILDIYNCLKSDTIPKMAEKCDYCNYRKSANEAEMTVLKNNYEKQDELNINEEDVKDDIIYKKIKEDFSEPKKLTASLIQKKYNIGFNRAARIMENIK